MSWILKSLGQGRIMMGRESTSDRVKGTHRGCKVAVVVTKALRNDNGEQ